MQQILKRVSRSFYLSLRLLPAPMQNATVLAYLLARTSDTIADSAQVMLVTRLDSLESFRSQLLGKESSGRWDDGLLKGIEHEGERDLLSMSQRLLKWFRELPDSERELVFEVLDTIIDGQRFDLEAFSHGTAQMPAVMTSAEQLDHYTYQVAGCVGEFWTKLGYETLGGAFASKTQEELLGKARDYGKGLQLINILRDLPWDLEMGRCYLPTADALDRQLLLAEFRLQHEQAVKLIKQGLAYASMLKGRRLRMASVLPAMLAEDTLMLLEGADWPTLETGVKISRSRVYSNLFQSLFY